MHQTDSGGLVPDALAERVCVDIIDGLARRPQEESVARLGLGRLIRNHRRDRRVEMVQVQAAYIDMAKMF